MCYKHIGVTFSNVLSANKFPGNFAIGRGQFGESLFLPLLKAMVFHFTLYRGVPTEKFPGYFLVVRGQLDPPPNGEFFGIFPTDVQKK